MVSLGRAADCLAGSLIFVPTSTARRFLLVPIKIYISRDEAAYAGGASTVAAGRGRGGRAAPPLHPRPGAVSRAGSRSEITQEADRMSLDQRGVPAWHYIAGVGLNGISSRSCAGWTGTATRSLMCEAYDSRAEPAVFGQRALGGVQPGGTTSFCRSTCGSRMRWSATSRPGWRRRRGRRAHRVHPGHLFQARV